MKKTFSGHEDREPDGGRKPRTISRRGGEIAPCDPHFTGSQEWFMPFSQRHAVHTVDDGGRHREP